jgi:DNA repair and recombination protein RAD54B
MMLKPFKPLTIRKPGTTDEQDVAAEQRPSKRRKLSSDQHEAYASVAPTPVVSRTHVGSSRDRTPLNTVRNPPSPQRSSTTRDDQFTSYYSVLWRNPTNKKNKTWTGDGVLVVRSGQATFYGGTGKQLGQRAFDKPLFPGSSVSMSGKDIEVESVLTKEAAHAIIHPKKSVKEPPNPLVPVSQVTPPKVSLKDKLKSAQNKSKNTAPAGSVVPHQSTSYTNPYKGVIARAPSNGERPVPRHDPSEQGALVFKKPKTVPEGCQIVDVVLDPVLNKKLRHHQREGVQFMYECVMGMRDFGGQGCILADDMGLGKTLQTIALLWTLIKQTPIHRSAPVVKKALIVCPVSLIKNWKKEFRKWLPHTNLGVLQFEDPKTTRLSMFDGKVFNIMIIGYERLRMVADDLAESHDIDIVICDEGHRLKTVKNKSAKAIESLNTPRRIILSGTPIQNDLSEFYAMVNFVNDGCLGSTKAFAKDFEVPIMKSRQPEALEEEIERGQAASDELASTTSPFILRRTADILANFLPTKTEYVLFCKPTPAQAHVYRNVVSSPMFRSALGSMDTALQLITILKKLCNSPALMKAPQEEGKPSSLTTLNDMLPSKVSKYYHNSNSAKIRLLDVLLQQIRTTTDEKVVLVSNYTSTLNLMGDLLESTGLKYLRLDGSVPAKQRQGLVEQFNRAKASHTFAFLLSAKAGGVGIDLTGASRLVLFDVDWNPATDDQAIARIHRQGQTRPTHIYRFLIKGGIEERIWQRQVVKRGLADSILEGGDGKTKSTSSKSGKATFSQEELSDLFRLDESEALRTHDATGCACRGTGDVSVPPSRALSPEVDAVDEADISSFVRSSQLSSNYPEDDTSTTSPVKRARKQRQSKQVDAEAEELMKYTHLDTSCVPQLGESDEAFAIVRDRIDDACLMYVLQQDAELVAGGVSYVFIKRTAVQEASKSE